MFPAVMSNSTSLSEEASVSSGTRIQDFGATLNHVVSTISPHQQQQQQQPPQKIKKKRSLPGNPDPDAEVIALSPKTLLATNRFVCEICNKGFQRDQNLQLHRRGHNLPWKLKQRNNKEVKKRAYVCPEPSCVHHNPSRALGDLTGIKKHYCRKHGEKKWKCDKCSKIYAVQSDWKAHSKTCGTREYRCDCGTLFSRKDSFITHRAFCDALAEESARVSANQHQLITTPSNPLLQSLFLFPTQNNFINPWDPQSSQENPNPNNNNTLLHNINIKPEVQNFHIPNSDNAPPLFLHQNPSKNNTIMMTSPFRNNPHVRMQPQSNSANNAAAAATSAHLSATALLQKAATVGAAAITGPNASLGVGQHVTRHVTELGDMTQLDSVHFMNNMGVGGFNNNTRSLKSSDDLTRDFLGLTGDNNGGRGGSCDGGNAGAVDVSMNVKDMLTYTGNIDYQQQHHHHLRHPLFKSPQQGFGFLGTTTAPESWGNC
ncbi:protein indeterminate-domain 12 [Arachis duranensis]|uniref:Protein indeterminate-domain 12 n=1 Tax=Arachis duranensis TaxID=130453 RepID=A0A6P4CBH7_ARADU|nr:protein indeterminate-domain 12 [Arachis duranensis]